MKIGTVLPKCSSLAYLDLSLNNIRIEGARRLAEAVEQMPAFSVDLDQVQTNMVYIGCEEGEADRLVSKLSKQGVDTLTIDDSSIRAVTHLHITDEDIDRAINAFDKAQ